MVTNANGKMKTNDPQITVTGHLKDGQQGELITFSVRLLYFELVAIVNIPAEGEKTAPVYIKFKVRPFERREQGAQKREDRDEAEG